MFEEYPLLLTATITPVKNQPILQLTDPEKRYRQYIENLVRFITSSNLTKFVFCENSETKIPHKEMLENLCSFYGKEIEFLSFMGNSEKVIKLTRAYGDQEIMEYALENSKLIQGSEGFYKITGRYWVKNINTIIDDWEKQKNVFIRGGLGMDTVHTAFIKTSKKFFKEHFHGKANQLPNFKNSLERLYYWYIKQSGVNLSISHIHPIFSAEWGSGGHMNESFIMQLKTRIFAWLGVYDIRTTKIQVGNPLLKSTKTQ